MNLIWWGVIVIVLWVAYKLIKYKFMEMIGR